MEKRGKGILSCLAIALPAGCWDSSSRWWRGCHRHSAGDGHYPGMEGQGGGGAGNPVDQQDRAPGSGGVPGVRTGSPYGGSYRETVPAIILSTITTSLVLSYVLHRLMAIPTKISTLVGVGSSICGGSAIAAAAPAIRADDEEVAQAISVIFFFNVLAAVLFPLLGTALGFSTVSGEGFGIFAGTAVNDTSSVTAAAATWDSMWNLGTATLDKAVTVKLTRTLAIIPITLGLSLHYGKKEAAAGKKFRLAQAVPVFVLYFVLASLATTLALQMGISATLFAPMKTLSKFLIVMAMAAIGLNSNIVKLIRTGGKPILLGGCCWIGITVVSLVLQKTLGLW